MPNTKEQIKENRKIYYLKNKEKEKQYAKEWYLKNPEYKKEYYLKNKEHQKEYYLKNAERYKEYRKKYRLKNPGYKKEYYYKNREKVLEAKRKYENNRLRRDPNFKLSLYLRNRVRGALKGLHKSDATMKLIGCTVEELWKHLESKFESWMTRENYGLWHVDHIKPCSKFDLIDSAQQRICFHYSNLQPLEAIENMKKGAKIISGDITSPKK